MIKIFHNRAEGSHRGRVRALGKRVYRKVSRVRIPPLPLCGEVEKNVRKIFASMVLVVVVFAMVGLPLAVSAGSCRCAPEGSAANASPCQPNLATGQACSTSGKLMSVSTGSTVNCTFFRDNACDPNQIDQFFSLSPSSTTDTTVGGGSGAGSANVNPATGQISPNAPRDTGSSDVPPGFPQPSIIIPTINVQIPGLTNFVAPHPGACPPTLSQLGITSCKVFPWIGQYATAAYNFGVAIAAFLAVVMVMWGGFLYITASGISSQAETAKTYIQGAFLGLIIVFTSYIMLATINPDLVKFQGLTVPDVPLKGTVPPLISLPNATTAFEKGEDIDVDSPTAATSTGAAPRRGTAPKPNEVASPPTAVTASGAPATPSVALCTYATKNDVVSDAAVSDALCPRLPGANGTYAGVKAAKDQPNGRPTDRATPQMIAAIQQLINRINGDPATAEAVGQWQITEGWPPTVNHSSQCHFRGCAIDIKLLGAVTPERIAAMDQVVNQMKTSGTFCYVLNEYTHQVKTTTGGNFHVESYSCP